MDEGIPPRLFFGQNLNDMLFLTDILHSIVGLWVLKKYILYKWIILMVYPQTKTIGSGRRENAPTCGSRWGLPFDPVSLAARSGLLPSASGTVPGTDLF